MAEFCEPKPGVLILHNWMTAFLCYLIVVVTQTAQLQTFLHYLKLPNAMLQ
jgi:hypothetical protein